MDPRLSLTIISEYTTTDFHKTRHANILNNNETINFAGLTTSIKSYYFPLKTFRLLLPLFITSSVFILIGERTWRSGYRVAQVRFPPGSFDLNPTVPPRKAMDNQREVFCLV